VWGFFFLYIASFAVMTILLAATGVDAVTAYSAVGACITNLGPALGHAGPDYSDLNSTAKVILSVAMLLGRLEIYTLLVLMTPAFWRD
jgi:trk system potassium uptake protein TrkH